MFCIPRVPHACSGVLTMWTPHCILGDLSNPHCMAIILVLLVLCCCTAVIIVTRGGLIIPATDANAKQNFYAYTHARMHVQTHAVLYKYIHTHTRVRTHTNQSCTCTHMPALHMHKHDRQNQVWDIWQHSVLPFGFIV